MAINPINSNVNSLNKINSSLLTQNTTDENQKDVSFIDYLYKAIEEVDSLQKEAEAQTELFISGQSQNPYDMAIASEKASLALSFTLQIRNKILDAYNEIMRMQV